MIRLPPKSTLFPYPTLFRSLDLDAPIARYLPEWTSGPQPEWRRKVTVRHLLTHTSGLPAFKEYWRTSKSKRSEEHTSELQSQSNLVCRLMLEKKTMSNIDIH